MEPSKIHSKKRVVQPNCKKNKLGYNYNLQKMVIEGTHMVIEPSKNGISHDFFSENGYVHNCGATLVNPQKLSYDT